MIRSGLILSVWDSESEIGYKQITTFWQDFCIAENFGLEAIKDTFKRAFKEWKRSYEYLTELVLILNHKSWQYYKKNDQYCEFYTEAYHIADAYALEHLKGYELEYYFKITD